MTAHRDLSSLRRTLRQQRRQIPPTTRRRYNRALCRRLAHHPRLLKSRHIALYLSNDGEPDLDLLIQQLWRTGKRLYLPILHPQHRRRRLWFGRYEPTSRLQPNRYGITEPTRATQRSRQQVQRLDLILMPLVGFTAGGERLGMGGGYYDRTLSFRRTHRARRPYLIGTAYEQQRLESLPQQPWDVLTDEIITEQRRYCRAAFQSCRS